MSKGARIRTWRVVCGFTAFPSSCSWRFSPGQTQLFRSPHHRPGRDVPEKKGKELRALAVGDKAPRIDGKFDDEVWGPAKRVEGLVQREPDNMVAPTERTVAQVAYDDRDVYVAVRCY